MQFGHDNGSTTSQKKKKDYIRPAAVMVTPDQAEAHVKAKMGLGREAGDSCAELIAEARRRQAARTGDEHGSDQPEKENQ